ncbi:TPA: type II toxin-antitoxin system YafQ family toxin, partial [Legionella pneumophila]|nr:type II toxin-antitoxin system YafQ family toxin [Legionella pneumophila]
MLELELATQFKRDLKKITKQGKRRTLLDSIVEQLQKEEPLDPKHKDHSLSVNWDGYRECHITPDWLLIY